MMKDKPSCTLFSASKEKPDAPRMPHTRPDEKKPKKPKSLRSKIMLNEADKKSAEWVEDRVRRINYI